MSYIEREALLKEFGEEPLVWMDTDEEIQANTDWNKYKRLVKNAPAADVVEVVRCKDYKHCQHDTMFNQMYCNGNRVTPEYFCADGERK